MATNDNLTQSIDYTSRDFYSLRNDLIKRVQTSLQENNKVWYGSDPADFGVAMVEAFAHIGDVTNYYIDRIANEALISTAVQRSSVLGLARSYGYSVAGYRQASMDALFVNSSADALTLPEGTVLSATVPVKTGDSIALVELFFTLDFEVVLDADGGSVTETISHGRNVSTFSENFASPEDVNDIAGELLGYSDGYSSQSFTLKYNQVVDDTVRVFVRNGSTFTEWVRVDSLAPYNSTDQVYTTSLDENNYITIQFGNGVSGASPVYGDVIKATYVVGGGLSGNLESGKALSIVYVPDDVETSLGTLNSSINATTTSNGVGGEDPESTASIRANAPKSFNATSRAVSLLDFKNLAIGVAGVGKTTAYAVSPTSVLVYVAPETADVSSDYYPGFNVTNTSPTTAWTDLQSSVSAELGNKTLVGTSVTVLPPVYSPVTMSVEYEAAEGYTNDYVKNAIRQAIIYGYGFNFLEFDQIIRPEVIEKTLNSLPGVQYAKVLTLYRTGDSVVRSALIPIQGEFFVFRDDSLDVYSAPSLSNLVVTIGNGSLSPAFNSDTTSYEIATTSSSMTVTPTAANTLTGFASAITVNGVAVVSGAASTSIALSVGQNNITVTLVSPDETMTKTYAVTVTRT